MSLPAAPPYLLLPLYLYHSPPIFSRAISYTACYLVLVALTLPTGYTLDYNTTPTAGGGLPTLPACAATKPQHFAATSPCHIHQTWAGQQDRVEQRWRTRDDRLRRYGQHTTCTHALPPPTTFTIPVRISRHLAGQ